MAGMHTQAHASAAALTKSDLRVLLDKQLGEHAVLAMNATNLGVKGSPAFAAAAKALDRTRSRSRRRSRPCTARRPAHVPERHVHVARTHQVLRRLHGRVAKKDTMAQNKAVANLKKYTVKFGDFLAAATGCQARGPQRPARPRARAQGSARRLRRRQLRPGSDEYQAAYAHMIMTGDLVAGAIAKQKNCVARLPGRVDCRTERPALAGLSRGPTRSGAGRRVEEWHERAPDGPQQSDERRRRDRPGRPAGSALPRGVAGRGPASELGAAHQPRRAVSQHERAIGENVEVDVVEQAVARRGSRRSVSSWPSIASAPTWPRWSSRQSSTSRS